MPGVIKTLLLCCTLLVFSSLVAMSAQITVDASMSKGDINTRIFGHNVRYFNNAVYLWHDPDEQHPSGYVVPTASDAIYQTDDPTPVPGAGTGTDAVIRFPGGNYNDLYHWRRGVGPLDRRPVDQNPHDPAGTYSTNFGTDELMELIDDVCPGGKPLIGSVWRRQRA